MEADFFFETLLPKKFQKNFPSFLKFFQKMWQKQTYWVRIDDILILSGKSRNTGWISIDRQNEPSLQLTIPGSFKSSTKDLKKWNEWEEKRFTQRRVIYTQLRSQLYSIRFSRVSSLEAFSCYPTHGSVAALSSRTTAFTGYAPQRFLSYWVAVLSECVRYSRIKLTCLATV